MLDRIRSNTPIDKVRLRVRLDIRTRAGSESLEKCADFDPDDAYQNLRVLGLPRLADMVSAAQTYANEVDVRLRTNNTPDLRVTTFSLSKSFTDTDPSAGISYAATFRRGELIADATLTINDRREEEYGWGVVRDKLMHGSPVYLLKVGPLVLASPDSRFSNLPQPMLQIAMFVLTRDVEASPADVCMPVTRVKNRKTREVFEQGRKEEEPPPTRYNPIVADEAHPYPEISRDVYSTLPDAVRNLLNKSLDINAQQENKSTFDLSTHPFEAMKEEDFYKLDKNVQDILERNWQAIFLRNAQNAVGRPRLATRRVGRPDKVTVFAPKKEYESGADGSVSYVFQRALAGVAYDLDLNAKRPWMSRRPSKG